MLSPSTPSAGTPRNAPDNEPDFLRSHSFPLRSLRVRPFVLTRWHSCLSPGPVGAGAQLRAHTTVRRRAVQGCRSLLGRFADEGIAMKCDGYRRRGRAGVVFRHQRDGVGGAPG